MSFRVDQAACRGGRRSYCRRPKCGQRRLRRYQEPQPNAPAEDSAATEGFHAETGRECNVVIIRSGMRRRNRFCRTNGVPGGPSGGVQ